MKYIGHNDPEEYMQIVEFSEKELRIFEKRNPTLFSICMYVSMSGILPGKFKTLDKRELIKKPEDIIHGCTYETDKKNHFCPIYMFFGGHIQDNVCKDCSCRIWREGLDVCCLERTWKEATCSQAMKDYTRFSINRRIERLKDSYKIHQGVKVV